MKTGIHWQNPKYALRPGQDFVFDPSLVLYLPLGKLDGASFTSKDARGHLCTVTGALWQPNGRDFDGTDDYVDCGNPASLNISAAMTVEAWFKQAGDAGWQMIASRDDGGANRDWQLATYKPETKLNFGFFSGGVFKEAKVTPIPSLNTWHYVVGVSDGTNIMIYLDGELKMTNSGGAIDTDPANIGIGARMSATHSENFNGIIDEVRIYNRALSPLEIQCNYLATKWRYQ